MVQPNSACHFLCLPWICTLVTRPLLLGTLFQRYGTALYWLFYTFLLEKLIQNCMGLGWCCWNQIIGAGSPCSTHAEKRKKPLQSCASFQGNARFGKVRKVDAESILPYSIDPWSNVTASMAPVLPTLASINASGKDISTIGKLLGIPLHHSWIKL